jgi:hypothetical protein
MVQCQLDAEVEWVLPLELETRLDELPDQFSAEDVCLATLDETNQQWQCLEDIRSPSTFGSADNSSLVALVPSCVPNQILAFAMVPRDQPVQTASIPAALEEGLNLGLLAGLLALLVLVLVAAYLGHRVHNYRSKYKATREALEDARDLVDELDAHQLAANAGDYDLTVNPMLAAGLAGTAYDEVPDKLDDDEHGQQADLKPPPTSNKELQDQVHKLQHELEWNKEQKTMLAETQIETFDKEHAPRVEFQPHGAPKRYPSFREQNVNNTFDDPM